MELDIISNLPSDVIEQILSHLPIRDAVRTSILSRNWRYRWAMIRHLVFDNQCVSTQKHISFVNIVDHVLQGHIGPIHKFELSYLDGVASRDIDRWIHHLSRNSVKEFILRIWKGYSYSIPSYMFSCKDMIHLLLVNCELKPPPTFKGFSNLKCLALGYLTLSQDVFQNLIACCPLLERLALEKLDFACLKIDAPNLQLLDVVRGCQDVIFENTLNLADVRIYTDANDDQRRVCDRSGSNLGKFLVHLPRIQRLKIEGYFLQILAAGALSFKLPEPCLHLNFLYITVNFCDPVEILTALYLLRSSPAVQELEISLYGLGKGEGEAALSEVNSLYGNWICPFTQLRLVKLSNLWGVKNALDFVRDFVRFLLLNSPVLEKIIIAPAYDHGSQELVKQVLRLGRDSVHSEIIFLDLVPAKSRRKGWCWLNPVRTCLNAFRDNLLDQ
ncbi:hypothetical protein ACE6H2_027579 [Prunus campanulata]